MLTRPTPVGLGDRVVAAGRGRNNRKPTPRLDERSHTLEGVDMPRAILVSFMVAAVLLLAATANAPAKVAECWPDPRADTRVERPFVFTATVREVATEPDLRSLGAGEVPGVLWQATLDVRHVFGAAVPDVLALEGSTSTVGVGGGCTWFLGDRVETGDVVLVAVDHVIPFDTNRNLFGHLMLWRRVGDAWRFYERALQVHGPSLRRASSHPSRRALWELES